MFKVVDSQFHRLDLSNYSFLVTGGAGFIGSNLVEYLVEYGAGHVRILDNLSTGSLDNLKPFLELPNVEFIKGDIRDLATCKEAVVDMDFISHQAALGSVPRSILDPMTSHEVNVNGFFNMMLAAKDSKVLKRMVYAASSSTYGDSPHLPKVVGQEGKPISPYAATKAINEVYAEVFSKTYLLHTIGLRYFNVFGPKQNPTNPYAAVIAVFCKNFLDGLEPLINGDGETSRDFTYVDNAVQANIRAMFYDREDPSKQLMKHDVFNVACGEKVTLNQVVKILQKISGKKLEPYYREERQGDIKHSLASIAKSAMILDYFPLVKFAEGLQLTYEYIAQHQDLYEKK
jgi:UDP-N-acetylglucosamine/UDP-N-acetylgalactosamine 4-epimerase